AHAERYFLTNSTTARTALQKLLYQPPRITYRGAEDYLQLAWDYADFGFTQDGAKVLRFYLKNVAGDRPYPLVLYTLAWFESELGHDQQAERLLARALALSPDYVFPHRVESIRVLQSAAEHSPRDWKARLYLGTLLTAKHRWQEGEQELLAAFHIDSSNSVLSRNLGQIAWQKRRDYRAAARWYERALKSAPDDWHVFVDLDRLYGILQANERREELFRSASPRVKRNFNVKLQEALFYVDTKRYDAALSILMNNVFYPWEGWTGAREVYLLAHFRRGLEALRAGAPENAIRDFRATLLYPENLGTGRPAYPRFARSFYFLGLAFQKAENPDSARFYFRKAAQENNAPASPLGVYTALALRELGETARADSLLRAGLAAANKKWAVPEWRSAQLAYCRGLLYSALGEPRKAEEAFTEAVRRNPEFRWAWWRL
ncbi:MAG: tetratricopeptide repeat protein, partial [Calditrichaeota bacterium]|nr:tetratricopeptide repeat protein [Calditrichota bacterium]